MQVGDPFDQLFEDALNFREVKLASHFEESCEVVIHILED
jgi:hypothetical protein